MKNLMTRSNHKDRMEDGSQVLEPTPEIVNDAPNPEVEPMNDELGRLRDILFGSHSRSMDKRLGELEAEIQSTRRELAEIFNDRIQNLAETSNKQVTETRNEFSRKLEIQSADQVNQARAVQKDLAERLERQGHELSAQSSAIQKELSYGLEKLEADFLRQVRAVQKELTDHIERVNAEQTERLRSLQADVRQRDEWLHNELAALATSLEHKKASRQELGQVLVEMGLRFRRESEENQS